MEKQAGTMKGLWSTVTGVTKSALAEMVGMSNDGSIRAGSAMERLKGSVAQLAGKLEQWQQDGTLARLGEQLDQGAGLGLDLASRGFQWLSENGDTGETHPVWPGGGVCHRKSVEIGHRPDFWGKTCSCLGKLRRR